MLVKIRDDTLVFRVFVKNSTDTKAGDSRTGEMRVITNKKNIFETAAITTVGTPIMEMMMMVKVMVIMVLVMGMMMILLMIVI